MLRRHHDYRTPAAVLPTTSCSEMGHVARPDTTEGRNTTEVLDTTEGRNTSEGGAVWQSGGAEEEHLLFCRRLAVP